MVEVAWDGSGSLEVTDVHSRSLEVARKLSETVCNGLSYISTDGIAVVTKLLERHENNGSVWFITCLTVASRDKPHE